jgi:hypothetical protein
MSEPQVRRRYNVGVRKIAFADRDVAHAVITDDDPRGFLDMIGADTADEDEVFPVGSNTTYSVELTDDEAAAFAAASNCRYIEPDSETYSCISDVPSFDTMAWMGADFTGFSAWHGRDVVIGMLDGGTTAAVRAALNITMLARNVYSPDTPGADEITSSHGCLVAPCLIPPGGKFLDAIVVDNAGVGSVSNTVAAAKWCADNGAKVINFSSAGPSPDSAYSDMLTYLANRGVQFFASAGNDNKNQLYYPAAYSTSFANCHSSISFDKYTGKRSTFSNYASTGSGCAPGTDELGLTPQGQVVTWSGTSASSPHMARLCAMGATGGRFTAAQMGAALKASTRNTGQPAAEQGAGAYSLEKALIALGALDAHGADYHPLAIIAPSSGNFNDGQYDFMANNRPGDDRAEVYLYHPVPAGKPAWWLTARKDGVDLSQWHNIAIEWTPAGLTGYLDGVPWWDFDGGASAGVRDAIQALSSGFLALELDNFNGSSGNEPATLEIDWVRAYTLTPSGPVTGPQTISPASISSAERIGTASVSVPLQAPPGTVPTRLGQATTTGTAGATVLPFTLTWTASTSTPPPGQKVITGAGGITRTDSVGAPVLTMPDGPQTAVAVGIAATDSYGVPVVSGDAAPLPAPGGVLVPALYAVGSDGHTLTPLPNWTKITLSPVRSSPGEVSIQYPAGTPGFDVLHDNVSASPLKVLEIRVWLGGSASASLGGWLTQKSGDDLTPGSNWTFAGSFHEWLLTKTLVAPQAVTEANKSGALVFAAANAGLILGTLMDQAQKRGALPLVTRDFSSTKDSNGQPWVNSISSLKLAPQTKVSEVADKLVELGMVEYELTAARVWRAYNPGGRGVDRTLGASPLTFAYGVNLRERARRETSKDAGTAVLVTGAEGFYSWASSATAQAQLGWRAEVAVNAGQLDSQSAVDGVAQSHLQIASVGEAEYNAAISFTPGSPLPLIDYNVGDWGYTRVGPNLKRLRIAQIQLEFAVGAAPKGTVAQNDLIHDKLSRLYRQLTAISIGDAVVGTSTPSPGGPAADYNPPAAPTGLTLASTIAYQVPGQTVTLAEIGAGWTAVTTNAYPDNDTAGKAAASVYMAARMASDLEFFEDWTWVGMPSIVDQYHEAMLEEWDASPRNPHGDNNTLGPAAQAWLDDYPTTHLGGGVITDDVAEYQVQFQYLGAQQVTTPGPRGEDPPDQLTPEGSWESPVNSPTRNTSITFGNVEGGRAVGVRVRAVDTTGNVGPWSIVVAIDSASDDQPPPSPSRPIAAAWFRTMNITWDGKGSSGEDMILAAPDILSGGGIEIHVAQGIDFLPDRPLGPAGKVDLSLSQTYKATLYDAGTYNVADLTIGQTYFARFVAVDRNGNASAPSDTSDPVAPQQLVNIDIGPDAISRLQIIDGEIVRAKIADAAINSAKVEEIEVGKLTAGTMNAQVIVGGRFSTPTSNRNHLEFDSAGIRLYQGNTVVGRWQVADASMLVTGTYLSALTGKRINILPTGTIIMYPPAGTNFGFIENLDGDIRISGQVNQDQRAGYSDNR